MKHDDRKVTIPFPCPTQNINRGFYLKSVPKTRPTTVRFTDDDRFTIEKIANSLNMSFGEFVRWASFYTAVEVGNELVRSTFQQPVTKKVVKEVDTTGYS